MCGIPLVRSRGSMPRKANLLQTSCEATRRRVEPRLEPNRLRRAPHSTGFRIRRSAPRVQKLLDLMPAPLAASALCPAWSEKIQPSPRPIVNVSIRCFGESFI